MVILASVLLVSGTLIAAAIDVRTRRIPNALTAALTVIALVTHVPEGGVAILVALATMLATFAAGILAFQAGWFGGGDVKLLTACCGFVSFPGCIAFVLDVLIAGALLALVSAALDGRLVALLRSVFAVATRGVPTGRNTMPYGVAIAGGSAVYTISSFIPALRLPL
jgi:prepilin peptidase CpaA